MSYDDLLKSKQIYRQTPSRESVEKALRRSERDLNTARALICQDSDWGFAIAYNAILQACRAYMFANGFRPSNNESHKNTFAFMRLALSEQYRDLVDYFDMIRNKRHQAIYEVAGLISQTEAQNLLTKAEEFVATIRKEISKIQRLDI